MSDFTPGPWYIAHGTMPDFDGSPIVTIYGDEAYSNMGGELIAITVDEGHKKSHDIANTNLICAAPDMYEALKWAIEFTKKQLESGCSFSSEDTPHWDAALKAIAKAEGEDV